VTNTTSTIYDSLTLSSGTQFNIEDCTLSLTTETQGLVTITNAGHIKVNQNAGIYFYKDTTFTGAGEVELAGGKLYTYAAEVELTNQQTIRGYGFLNVPIINEGTITAEGGTLEIEKNVTNTNHQINIGEGGKLLITNGAKIDSGTINPQGNEVKLSNAKLKGVNFGNGTVNVVNTSSTIYDSLTLSSGTQFNIEDNRTLYLGTETQGLNHVTISNAGHIKVNQNAGIYFNKNTTFTGAGEVELAGGKLETTYGGVELTNQQTIRGHGTIAVPVTNEGTIIAEGGELDIKRYIEGGEIKAGDGGKLKVKSDIKAKDLVIEENSEGISVNSYKKVTLTGDLILALQDEGKWIWGDGSSLIMAGGDENGWQKLEVGGEDMGTNKGGFITNFALEKLELTDNAEVALVDLIDNGNRHSPEALYVEELVLGDNATLNLNGINLYTYQGNNVIQVAVGSWGGGQIVNSPVPIPSSGILILSGLLGLGIMRRRFF